MQKALYFRNKGELVAGTLHLPDNRRRCPGVLMCHGFTGQKSESHFYLVALSRRLAEAGIASLRFDFRGSGESEGEFEDMTPLEEVSDARAALRQLAGIARVDERRLGIFGWSLGGLVATPDGSEGEIDQERRAVGGGSAAGEGICRQSRQRRTK